MVLFLFCRMIMEVTVYMAGERRRLGMPTVILESGQSQAR
jgi:hypothetical protein